MQVLFETLLEGTQRRLLGDQLCAKSEIISVLLLDCFHVLAFAERVDVKISEFVLCVCDVFGVLFERAATG